MQVTQEDDLRRTMRSGAGAAPRESPSQLYQRQRNNPFQETDKHRVVAMLSSQEGSKKEGKTENKQTNKTFLCPPNCGRGWCLSKQRCLARKTAPIGLRLQGHFSYWVGQSAQKGI